MICSNGDVAGDDENVSSGDSSRTDPEMEEEFGGGPIMLAWTRGVLETLGMVRMRMVKLPGANVIKLFTVIYEFS